MSRDRPHEREARNGERTRRDRGREGCSDLTSTAFDRSDDHRRTQGRPPATLLETASQVGDHVGEHVNAHMGAHVNVRVKFIVL